jgi:hypothetical protein
VPKKKRKEKGKGKGKEKKKERKGKKGKEKKEGREEKKTCYHGEMKHASLKGEGARSQTVTPKKRSTNKTIPTLPERQCKRYASQGQKRLTGIDV